MPRKSLNLYRVTRKDAVKPGRPLSVIVASAVADDAREFAADANHDKDRAAWLEDRATWFEDSTVVRQIGTAMPDATGGIVFIGYAPADDRSAPFTPPLRRTHYRHELLARLAADGPALVGIDHDGTPRRGSAFALFMDPLSATDKAVLTDFWGAKLIAADHGYGSDLHVTELGRQTLDAWTKQS